jgi:hypothetical protein
LADLDEGLNGRIIRVKLELTEIVCDGVEWIDLAQDMGWWPAFVIVVVNLLVL